MVAPRRRRSPAAGGGLKRVGGLRLFVVERDARRRRRKCKKSREGLHARALRCGGVDGYAMVGGGSTLSSRLANLLSGDVLLRSPPPFRATEEAWERESLTTHTSSAERLLLRKYGLRRLCRRGERHNHTSRRAALGR